MVNEEKVSIIYKGNGKVTSFDYPYELGHGDDIEVYISEKGAIRKLLKTEYRFSEHTKRVEYPLRGEPLAEGEILMVNRRTERSNLVSLPDQSPFDDIERQFDKTMRIIQEIESRTIGQPLTVISNTFNGNIPKGRPYAFLRFNKHADGFEVIDNPFEEEEGHLKEIIAMKDDMDAALEKVKVTKDEVVQTKEEITEEIQSFSGKAQSALEVAKTQLREVGANEAERVRDAFVEEKQSIRNNLLILEDTMKVVDAAKETIRGAEQDADRAKAYAEQAQVTLGEFENKNNDMRQFLSVKEETIEQSLADSVATVKKLIRTGTDAVEDTIARNGADLKAYVAKEKQEVAYMRDVVARDTQSTQEHARISRETLGQIEVLYKSVQERERMCHAVENNVSAHLAACQQGAEIATNQAALAKQYAEQAKATAGGNFLTEVRGDQKYATIQEVAVLNDMMLTKANTTYVDSEVQKVEKKIPTDWVSQAAFNQSFTTLQSTLEKSIANQERFNDYVLKADAFTQTQADKRYMTKGTAYTKGESDRNYVTKTEAFTQSKADALYVTKSAADSKFATQAAMTQVSMEVSKKASKTDLDAERRTREQSVTTVSSKVDTVNSTLVAKLAEFLPLIGGTLKGALHVPDVDKIAKDDTVLNSKMVQSLISKLETAVGKDISGITRDLTAIQSVVKALSSNADRIKISEGDTGYITYKVSDDLTLALMWGAKTKVRPTATRKGKGYIPTPLPVKNVLFGAEYTYEIPYANSHTSNDCYYDWLIAIV